MRFVFRLQPLLEIRRRAEEVEQRAVAELDRERMRFEKQLRRRQSDITEAKHGIREGLTGVIDMTGLRLRAGSTLHQVRQAQQLVLKLAGVHKQIEKARVRLVEATCRRRALELLRERRFTQWKAGLEKKETAALDELAVMRAAGERSNAQE